MDLKVCFWIYSDQACSPCTKQSPPSPLEVSLVTGLTFQFSVTYNQLKFKKYDIGDSRSFKNDRFEATYIAEYHSNWSISLLVMVKLLLCLV